MLTREQLLASAEDLPTAEVDIPAWGGRVRFRGMRLAEKMEFDAAMKTALDANDHAAARNLQIALIAITMIDAEGAPMLAGEDDQARVAKFKPEGFRAAIECVLFDLNGYPRAPTKADDGKSEGEQSPLADSAATTADASVTD